MIWFKTCKIKFNGGMEKNIDNEIKVLREKIADISKEIRSSSPFQIKFKWIALITFIILFFVSPYAGVYIGTLLFISPAAVYLILEVIAPFQEGKIKRLEEERNELIRIRAGKEREKKAIVERVAEGKKLEFEKKQLAKGPVEYKGKWVSKEKARRLKEIDIGLENNFANINPYEFEEFIAKLFRKMGYQARRTRSVGDFGADVIAKRGDETVLIEVKKYAQGHNVTPKEVQRTLGAMWKHKADKAVFVTTSDFTIAAGEIEKEGPIELWNKRVLHQMVRKYLIDAEIDNA